MASFSCLLYLLFKISLVFGNILSSAQPYIYIYIYIYICMYACTYPALPLCILVFFISKFSRRTCQEGLIKPEEMGSRVQGLGFRV